MVQKKEKADDLNKNTPIISVIVPFYNGAAYLPKAIESMQNQTFHQIEIILINDGSEDESQEICNEYARDDKRIKVLQNQGAKGVSGARNTGLAVACGNYISFLDADDWMEPDMLEYLWNLIQESKADIATCEIMLDYPNGKSFSKECKKKYQATSIQVIDEINFGGEFTTFLVTKLFQRDLLNNISFRENISIGEDYRFMMEVLLKNPTIIRGDLCKYHYLQHAESACHRGFSNQRSVYRNRQNFKETYEMLFKHQDVLKQGALAYYILQEMAVITSMVKAHHYDRMIAKSVQREVRRHIKDYLRIKRVPLYLKVCAVLLSTNEYLLLFPVTAVFYLQKCRNGS